jgi:hypothetical protein
MYLKTECINYLEQLESLNEIQMPKYLTSNTLKSFMFKIHCIDQSQRRHCNEQLGTVHFRGYQIVKTLIY